MNTDQYFKMFYEYTAIGIGYQEAYELSEKKYRKETGKHKYINYQTFRRMKTRYMASKRKI